MKENKKFSDFKGSNVHELSNEAFIPVVTPDENFKINVTELSTEELHAGNNIEINNEHKIIATNTELTPGGNGYISIENDIISYTGPKGTSRTITPAKYSVPGEELQNIEINDNKIDLVLTFGEEVNEEHRSNKIPSVASNSTGSYFKYKNGSLVLEPHFAGFNNRMLFFNKDLDTIPSMSLGTELFRLHIDIDNKQDGIIYLDRGITGEPIYYLNNNGEFVNDVNDAINVLPYSQIIYDFKTCENQLYSINIHSNWLRRIAHKEITLIQLNKSTKNYSAQRNINPAIINIVNDDPEPSHIANYYFYHNGKLYTKENVIGKQVFLIFGNVLAIDPTDTNVYTDLRSNTGEINPYGGAIGANVKSIPFASHIDQKTGAYFWIINTVNRFYCITEDIDENTTNFYIIESMY